MRIRVEGPVPRDVVVDTEVNATVGDLTAALVPGGGPTGARIDGAWFPPTAPLVSTGIGHGSGVGVDTATEGGAAAGGVDHRPGAQVRREGLSAPLHRPRRDLPPPPPPPIPLPARPAGRTPAPPLALAGLVASVLMAAGLVWLLRSWAAAAMGLFGPVLILASVADGRRARRRGRRRDRRRRRRELAQLDETLAAAGARERAWRALRYPDLSTIAAAAADGTCWARRLDHHDARAVCIGAGTGRWEPVLTGDSGADPDVTEVVDRHRTLVDTALGLDLNPGEPVALVGPHHRTAGLARAVVAQLVALHGPADVSLAVLTAPEHAAGWDWCAWVPHAHHPVHGLLLAGDEAAAAMLVPALTRPSTHDGVTVLVVDDPSGLAARRGSGRQLLRIGADPKSRLLILVLVPDQPVPAPCRHVVEVDPHGGLRTAVAAGEGRALHLPADEARVIARHLARYDDPEVDDPGRGLPEHADPDISFGDLTPEVLGERWTRASAAHLPAILGAGVDGPVEVDLVRDGPHLLVAGTTGSGKSELLRTLIASLAVRTGPDRLSFVLVDFKGGSAFDACARLPHVTGVVTDLDDHLAARALRCLEAELRRREQLLRSVGVTDLVELDRRDREHPLARLVVVVDELAALISTVDGFIDGLVDLGQRGRSLGIHLVLATQHPAGVVGDRLRANVNAAIALRVLTPTESNDVIGGPEAASLSRRHPGRALVRLGTDEALTVQAAWATAPARPPVPVRVRPLGVARSVPVPFARPVDGGPTILDLVGDAASRAWASAGGPPPPCPWPPPLPTEVSWPLDRQTRADAPPNDQRGWPPLVPIIGLADHPDEQTRRPWRWEAGEGPLVAVGLPGTGTTTAAATVVLDAVRTSPPDRLHVHLVGGPDLGPLAGLPHVGAVIGPDDHERQRRLLADLAADLATRRIDHGGASTEDRTSPNRLLVVDGIGTFRRRWDDLDPSATWSHLLDLATHGPAVGLHLLVTGASAGEVPHRLLAACHQRLVFRLADPADRAVLGVCGATGRAIGALPAGRATALPGSVDVQVARAPEGLASAVARIAGDRLLGALPPRWIGRLPTQLVASQLGSGRTDRSGFVVPLGIRDDDLATAFLAPADGGHVIVAGPARSGRTNTLRLMAAHAARQGWSVVVIARRGGEWHHGPVLVLSPHDSEALSAAASQERVVVLVDDVDPTAASPVLAALVADRRPGRHVVVAGRNDLLRATFRGWIREAAADRCGVLLQPDPDLDGDLLGVRLTRTAVGSGTHLPGRAHVVGLEPGPDGVVQLALSTAPRQPDTGCESSFPPLRLPAGCQSDPLTLIRRNP